MATNIDKVLNQAPMGLEENDFLGEPDIEIEIEDPENVTITTDGLEVTIFPEDEDEDDFDSNLAEFISEDILSGLANDIISDYEDDVNARRDWMQTYVDGLELLGMQIEERSEPWPGACGVYHPLLSEALVKFQAETMMETFPAQGPVKVQIIGKETKEKEQASLRVKNA